MLKHQILLPWFLECVTDYKCTHYTHYCFLNTIIPLNGIMALDPSNTVPSSCARASCEQVKRTKMGDGEISKVLALQVQSHGFKEAGMSSKA